MASKQTFVVRRRASRWPDPPRRGKTNERGHAGLVWWARRLASAPGARRVGQSRHASNAHADLRVFDGEDAGDCASMVKENGAGDPG